MGFPVTMTGPVKPLVVSISRPQFSENPLLAACVLVEKEKEEWLVVGKTKGMLQTAVPLFLEAPTGKGKNRPTLSTSSEVDISASYAEKIRQQK